MTINKISDYLHTLRLDASSVSADVLEAIPYDRLAPDTWVEIEFPEFTSLCPRTGLPDFGTIAIRYLPDRAVVELKSLKYYFLQYRNCGIFYEQLTPQILNHLVWKLQPLEMEVKARFTSRGGLSSSVVSRYKK